MQRVSPGQPIKAATQNAMMHAIEAINYIFPASPSGNMAKTHIYPTLPAFSVTLVNGTAYVSNGMVYIDNTPISGEQFGAFGGSISNYNEARTGTEKSVWVAIEYNLDKPSGVDYNDEALEGSSAGGIAYFVWSALPPVAPTNSEYEYFHSVLLATIVVENGNKYVKTFHRGNIFISPTLADFNNSADVPLAQYLNMPMHDDVPGKIAGIQRIPFDSWVGLGTTSVDGIWQGSASSIEHIADGVIYLREPRQYGYANYHGDSGDRIGVISSIAYTSFVDKPCINHGAIELPMPDDVPHANHTPYTFDEIIGDPAAAPATYGTIRSITATSAVDGIPRIIDGDVFLPASNYSADRHTDTPGYILGIEYTSGIERPRIEEGRIMLPMPVDCVNTPKALGGIMTPNGGWYKWEDMVDGEAYKIGESPTYGYSQGLDIHPTVVYAIKQSGLAGYDDEHSFLSIIVMSGSHPVSVQDLDSRMSNFYTTHTT